MHLHKVCSCPNCSSDLQRALEVLDFGEKHSVFFSQYAMIVVNHVGNALQTIMYSDVMTGLVLSIRIQSENLIAATRQSSKLIFNRLLWSVAEYSHWVSPVLEKNFPGGDRLTVFSDATNLYTYIPIITKGHEFLGSYPFSESSGLIACAQACWERTRRARLACSAILSSRFGLGPRCKVCHSFVWYSPSHGSSNLASKCFAISAPSWTPSFEAHVYSGRFSSHPGSGFLLGDAPSPHPQGAHPVHPVDTRGRGAARAAATTISIVDTQPARAADSTQATAAGHGHGTASGEHTHGEDRAAHDGAATAGVGPEPDSVFGADIKPEAKMSAAGDGHKSAEENFSDSAPAMDTHAGETASARVTASASPGDGAKAESALEGAGHAQEQDMSRTTQSPSAESRSAEEARESKSASEGLGQAPESAYTRAVESASASAANVPTPVGTVPRDVGPVAAAAPAGGDAPAETASSVAPEQAAASGEPLPQAPGDPPPADREPAPPQPAPDPAPP